MEVGAKVIVSGFKVAGKYDSANFKCAQHERDHIQTFIGNEGIIEFIDHHDPHPIMVWFGPDATFRRTRFAESELRTIAL